MATLGYTDAFPGASAGSFVENDVAYLCPVTLDAGGGSILYTNGRLVLDGAPEPAATVRMIVCSEFLGMLRALSISDAVTGMTVGEEMVFNFSSVDYPAQLPTGEYWVGFIGTGFTGVGRLQWADGPEGVALITHDDKTYADFDAAAPPESPTGAGFLVGPDTPPDTRPWLVYLTTEAPAVPASDGGLAAGASGVAGGGSYGPNASDAVTSGTGGGDADPTAADGELQRSGVVGGGGYS